MKFLFFLGSISLVFWGLTGLLSVGATPWETAEGVYYNPNPEPGMLLIGAACFGMLTFIVFMGPWAGERRLYRTPWSMVQGALAGYLIYSLEYEPMHQYLPWIVAGSLAVWFLTMPYCILMRDAPRGMRPVLLPALKVSILGMLFGTAYIAKLLKLSEQKRNQVGYVLDMVDVHSSRAIDWVEASVAYLLHTVRDAALVAGRKTAQAAAAVDQVVLKPLWSLTLAACKRLGELMAQFVHNVRMPAYATINPKPL